MTLVVRVTALLGIIFIAALPAAAQSPTVTVYFDEAGTQRVADGPGAGLDTLYVITEDFGSWINGIEYKIELPPSMQFISDIDLPPVTFGSSVTGVSMGFPLPRNAFLPVEVQKIVILWTDADCALDNQRVRVVPHPLFGFVRASAWPRNTFIVGSGRSSAVCPSIALDIEPRRCPNIFEAKRFDLEDAARKGKGGFLRLAVLGSATFNVTDIDVSSVRLESVPVETARAKIRDVATPVGDNVQCACTSERGDGHNDLFMRIRIRQLTPWIAPVVTGDRVLALTGTYLDGIPFETTDCLRIIDGARPKDEGRQNPDGLWLSTQDLAPREPRLDAAVPNPFNPETRLTYVLPSTRKVRLAVYDVSGRLVDLLADGVKEAGEHNVIWDASGLASGVYFYRLQTGGKTLVRRMVLLK